MEKLLVQANVYFSIKTSTKKIPDRWQMLSSATVFLERSLYFLPGKGRYNVNEIDVSGNQR